MKYFLSASVCHLLSQMFLSFFICRFSPASNLYFIFSLVYNDINPVISNPDPQEYVVDLGGLSTNRIRMGQIVRLFWSCYMHLSWSHISLNLITQFLYLQMFEQGWGFMRCLIIFWSSALSGNLMSSVMSPCTITVGSSGSMFGLLAASFIFTHENWDVLKKQFKFMPYMIVVLTLASIVVQILLGMKPGSGADNWAHIGGAVGGLCTSMATIRSLDVLYKGKLAKLKKEQKSIKSEKKKPFFLVWYERRHLEIPMRNGIIEWIVRLIGIISLTIMWSVLFLELLYDPEYQPVGDLTFSGGIKCCCCRPPYINKFDKIAQPWVYDPETDRNENPSRDIDDFVINTEGVVSCSTCRSNELASGYDDQWLIYGQNTRLGLSGSFDPDANVDNRISINSTNEKFNCSWVLYPVRKNKEAAA